ncbi:MAG TPA: polysaccharide deacetylase family protein [Polyangia bacterium]|nr:polysaccharide deacetylase family protein [Polyangia bacterium]
MRVCSISIDLDPLSCYYGIHGLGEPPAPLTDVVLRRALPRFAEMLERRRIHATFFVVGSDVERDPSGRAQLGQLARGGHELGNHSQTHPYELARLPRERIEEEVGRAHDVIAEVAGEAPVGFRAPGYDLSQALSDVLMARGYRYDSSVFPSWPYYFAKAGVMAAMALVGRRSRSVLGDPRALLAPVLPYRPGRSPYSRGQATLVELPISVSPGLRLPVIGSWAPYVSLLLGPTAVRAHLLESMRGRPFFNLELHGIDLIGADEDGIPSALVARQPDLRVSLTHKRRALEATLDRLASEYRFSTLRDVATEVQREGLTAA